MNHAHIMNRNQGFTLVELVVVIVILGVLAASAMPRMVGMSDDARNAAAQGLAGAMTSAYTLNYANRQIDNSRGSAITGTTSASICEAILPQLLTPLPAGASLSLGTGTDCTGGSGTTANCIVSIDSAQATATAICT